MQNPNPAPQDAFLELFKEVDELEKRALNAKIPDELKDKIKQMLIRLKRMARFGGYSEEYEKIAHYVDWVISLPWFAQTEDNLDLNRAKQILDKHHYGMEEVKQKILEYLAVLKLNKDKNKQSRAPIMLLVGLVGTGKTTFGPALAEALGRQYARIPFGGMSSPLDLRGQSRLHPDTEPGSVVKALRDAQSKNPIILLDEIDRVEEKARGAIMGVLVELLDPGQNYHFLDHYLDYPFDLSKVLFIGTCNNTRGIATAVLDRMEVIQMPSYSDEEKVNIGKYYILPRILEEAGLSEENVIIEDSVWQNIVRPLGYDSGIRTLERTIRGVVNKVAKLIVEGHGSKFILSEENIKPFLPSY
ncbi:AAA family ATPase [Candidatus Beckwithbacteria bacterium]|nr:AAA family ATPase [Candidatus Beckwithbacteria bacterium]